MIREFQNVYLTTSYISTTIVIVNIANTAGWFYSTASGWKETKPFPNSSILDVIIGTSSNAPSITLLMTAIASHKNGGTHWLALFGTPLEPRCWQMRSPDVTGSCSYGNTECMYNLQSSESATRASDPLSIVYSLSEYVPTSVVHSLEL